MTRIRSPKLTIRARLTLVYGGLFLFVEVLLLGVTYALVSRRLPGGVETDSRGTPPDAETESSLTRHTTEVAEDSWYDALDALLTQGAIALAVVGAGAVALVWLIAGRMLQPLHRVTETARRIADAPAADRGLHERIALSGPHDEVKDLADTFDLMLAHLDRSFDGQRRFISNASHELRTPLAVNRALLEVALNGDSVSPPMRQLGETLLEVNARHERLITGLLVLTRSEREVTDRSYVDLADIVEHVTAQLPRGDVAVHVESSEAPTTGNPVLLERCVHNLVENGMRYNLSADGWIRITSDTRRDGWAEVRVSNTGPVVPRFEIPTLFEPFRRLGAERLSNSPGAGLGLSIVRAVARAHGGDVHAEPRDGGGLTVTVTLPPARTEPDADP